MARKAAVLKLLDKAPALPEGLKLATFSRGLKQVGPDGKPLVSDGSYVVENAKGEKSTVKAGEKLPTLKTSFEVFQVEPGHLSVAIDFLTKMLGGETSGRDLVEGVLNDFLVSEIPAQFNTQNVKDHLRMIPRIPSVSSVDPDDVIDANFRAWRKAHPGKAPNAKDMTEITSGKDLTAVYASIVKA